MKKYRFIPIIVFTLVYLLTGGCKKNNPDNQDVTLIISSVNKSLAMPASQIVISGSGFNTDAQLYVRFFNDADYQIDVPVFQANDNQLIVTVPPFINTVTKEYEAGKVSIMVVAKSNSRENTSNSIADFSIINMPESEASVGKTTLIYLDAQLDYYQQLQQEIAGTELGTSEMLGNITANKANLSSLHAKIKTLVNSPGGLNSSFAFGSINGQEIKISVKDIEHCDRFILAMFAALKSADQPDPLVTETSQNKSPEQGVCLSQAEMAYNDLITGVDNSANYAYNSCLVSAQPQAVITASNVVFGAGSIGLGIVALACIGLEIPVAVALALPVAAITYATITTGGFQIGMGANLANINNDAARKALNAGVKQIDDMLLDMAIGTVLSDTQGAIKDLLSGISSLSDAFMGTYTLSNCTYTLSSASVQMAVAGGSGVINVTSGSECNWTSTSSNSWISISSGTEGTGNGTVSYSVQANASSQERTGAIQIADKSFSVIQQANPQSGPYDGNWLFTMVGTFLNNTIEPPTWPYPQTTAPMSIVGHDLIGFGDYGIGVLNADGYAQWNVADIFTYSGTFYTSGTGVGSWTYGPDGAGTTASGTWSAVRQ